MLKEAFARLIGIQRPRSGVAPPPNLEVAPQYPEQEVVSIGYSPSNAARVIVTKDLKAGFFRVHREDWDNSGWAFGGSSAWVITGGSLHFCDTRERAEELASEELRGTSR